MKKKIEYLKGFDSIRAFAAIIVLVSHIELFKLNYGLSNFFYVVPSGHLGVIMFFVLSGFLITYLLINEKNKSNAISLKKFYMRRILRIWPLYYAILIISFFFVHANYSLEVSILCFSIFPNVAHALNIGWPSSPQIWSIGVEEQFYLFWPVLLYIISNKRMLLFLILFFLGFSLIPHVIDYINNHTLKADTLFSFNKKFFYVTKFNCLALGGIFAYIFYFYRTKIKYYFNLLVLIFFILMAIMLLVLNFSFKYFNDEFYAIIFGIILISISINQEVVPNLKLFTFLGKISFGIYMYHWLILIFFFTYFKPYLQDYNFIVFNIFLYSFVLLITTLLSWISYRYFESYFLVLKNKYFS